MPRLLRARHVHPVQHRPIRGEQLAVMRRAGQVGLDDHIGRVPRRQIRHRRRPRRGAGAVTVVLQHDEGPIEQLGAEENAALVGRLGRAGARVHADDVAHDPRRVRRRYEDDVLGIPAGALVRHAVPVAVGQLGETARRRRLSERDPVLVGVEARIVGHERPHQQPAVDVMLLPPGVMSAAGVRAHPEPQRDCVPLDAP